MCLVPGSSFTLLLRLQPSGNAWGGSAGPAAHSPAGGDNTSRAVKRLKDMYARNVSQAALDKAPEAQGVRQLLAVRRDRCLEPVALCCLGLFPAHCSQDQAGNACQKCIQQVQLVPTTVPKGLLQRCIPPPTCTAWCA